MGKRGSRQKEAKDYRKGELSPVGHRVAHDFQSRVNRVCASRPAGTVYCCSRENCYTRRGPAADRRIRSYGSPNKYHRARERYPGEERRMRKTEVEQLSLKARQRKTSLSSSSCSTCSSCDSCFSERSFYTRVELKNNIFTSPLQSTEASFYQTPYNPPVVGCKQQNARDPKRQSSKQSPPEERHRSPKRRGGSCTGDFRIALEEPINKQRKAHKSGKEPRRANSFNGGPSFLEESNCGALRQRGRSNRTANCSDSRAAGNAVRKSRKDNDRSSSPSRTPSGNQPSRSTKRSDSGVGRSYTTSGSSAGDLPSDEEKENRNRRVKKEEQRSKRSDRESSKNARNLQQVDLLNRMVSQTKEHRKQIRTLENELERLRLAGDTLASCEVNQRDVEWRPGDVVGEGSFSIVYKGSYCGTEVAVKELKCKLSQDDKNYFRSEAALLQQLHHPRIVLLMGICTASIRPFMLLEYLSEGTLYSLIHSKKRERLDHAAYFSIAKDVSQGMNYLHRHDPQVLHLDLKSMNVLLDSYTRAKIADFGFSILRRTRQGSGVERGSIRGTPAWMAPELLTSGDVSPKCDVYSFAIILWEMLTAAHPFQGLDIYRIMEAVENGVRPPLPTSGVSTELRELIISCWTQNPSLRPSFEEVLAALESAALPASWRNVLYKANIGPSALSNVKTTRAIIGMVEQSAEILVASVSKKPNRKAIDFRVRETEIDPVADDGRKQAVQSSYPDSARKRSRCWRREERSSSGDSKKKSQGRELSPSKTMKMKAESRRETPRKNDFVETVEVRNRERKERNSGQSRMTEQRKIKNLTRIHKSKDRARKQVTKQFRSPARSQRYNVENATEDIRSALSSSCESSASLKILSDDVTRRQQEEETGYSDGSDSIRAKYSLTEAKARQKSRTKSPVRKGTSSKSPVRPSQTQSPYRRQRSPNRRRSDLPSDRRHEGVPSKGYGGLILTAEQLLSQKKRLRPVRPSRLSDLSLLPQSSLNDISFILKEAMSRRRKALEQLHSVRDSVPSKNIQDWSEWY